MDDVSSDYSKEKEEQPKERVNFLRRQTMQKNVLKLCGSEALVKLPVNNILKRVSLLRSAFEDLITENDELIRRHQLRRELISSLDQSHHQSSENQERTHVILELQETVKEQKRALALMRGRSGCSYCERYVEIIKKKDRRIEQLSRELKIERRQSVHPKSWFNWWWPPNKSDRKM